MLHDIDFYRKHKYLYRPRIMQIEITNHCPLKCPQCYKSPNEKYMSFDTFTKYIDMCHECGVKSIMINGGEPALHPNFLNMIEYIDKQEMSAFCFLSGLGLTQQILDQLDQKRVNISISLNGSTREINQLSRDGFEVSMKAIEKLSTTSLQWGINWVARHDNVSNFPQIVMLAVKYGAHHINIISNKTCGQSVDSPMTQEDFYTLSHMIAKYRKLYAHDFFIYIESCFSLLNAYMDAPALDLYLGCGAGIIMCFISVDGYYMPCSHLNYPEKFDSLRSYWERSPILSLLRDNLVNPPISCQACVHHTKCRFCRAVSKETQENLTIGYKDCPVKIEDGSI